MQVKRFTLSADTLTNDAPLQAEWRTNASDGTQFLAVRLYNGLASATVVGRPYLLVYDGDEELNPKVTTPTTSSVYHNVVVALEAVPANGIGWFAIQGYVNALVDGTVDVAKDDFLKVINNGTAFIRDGTARTVNSVGVATDSQTADSPVSIRVYLIGDRVNISAT